MNTNYGFYPLCKILFIWFAKSNISTMIFLLNIFSQISWWMQFIVWPIPVIPTSCCSLLSCISHLYLIIIQNDRWPQIAMSCTCSAVSINHKQSTHPFGVYIHLNMDLNNKYVNKVMGNSSHKVYSPKHSLSHGYFQFDICNQSYLIPGIFNEINYNASKQLTVKVRYRKVYLQYSQLKILPWLPFPHKFIF